MITGTNLTSGDVEFGGIPGTDVTCTSDTSCSAVAPAGATGSVDVTVHAFAGVSPATPAGAFTYLKPPPPAVSAISPATGPQTGGTAVTVTGTNLLAGTVSFGSATAIDSSCTQTTCTATQPPGSPGSAGVTVQTAGGTSATSAASSFSVSAIQVSEVPVPGLASGEEAGGGHVYAARDGTIWFTLPTQDEVGHIAADGTVTTYPAPDASALPVGITQTADGTVWYTEENAEKLVSIAPDGKQTVHDLPGHADDVRDITVGPDGRLWMPLAQDAAVIAMTTSGAATIYRLPDVASYPLNIVAGPDGRLWFTEPYADAIGAITTSGQLTEYPLPEQGLEPWGICVGPDGRLWFTEAGRDNLGAITTGGAVTKYPLSPAGTTTGITSGPDGRLWFTVAGRDELGALDPVTGTQAEYSLEPHETLVQPNYLTMSSDGTLWASEFDGGQMIRLTGATAGVAPSVHGVWPDYGPPAGGTPVTVSGANLSGATAVMFGSRPATSVTDEDAGHVLAVAPAGASAVTVTVVTTHGTTTATPAGVYHYGTPPVAAPVITAVGPATGVTSGGGKVLLTGSGLAGAAVRFGTRLALSSSCTAGSCTVTAPPGTGQVNVIATTAAGPSATSPADVFTYLTPAPPLPTVTRVSPASGPSSGGTKVTVTGTHLAGGIVSFGLTGVPASCTATSCTAVAPPGGPGIISLQVITAGGISAVTSADRYTYLGPRLSAGSATLGPTAHERRRLRLGGIRRGVSGGGSVLQPGEQVGAGGVRQARPGSAWRLGANRDGYRGAADERDLKPRCARKGDRGDHRPGDDHVTCGHRAAGQPDLVGKPRDGLTNRAEFSCGVDAGSAGRAIDGDRQAHRVHRHKLGRRERTDRIGAVKNVSGEDRGKVGERAGIDELDRGRNGIDRRQRVSRGRARLQAGAQPDRQLRLERRLPPPADGHRAAIGDCGLVGEEPGYRRRELKQSPGLRGAEPRLEAHQAGSPRPQHPE